jgi:hypothetical protein
VDPEIQAAWAVHLAGQAHMAKARGTGGELEALDTAGGAQAQLVKLLRARASPQDLPRNLVNGAVLVHFGLNPPGPRLVPVQQEA